VFLYNVVDDRQPSSVVRSLILILQAVQIEILPIDASFTLPDLGVAFLVLYAVFRIADETSNTVQRRSDAGFRSTSSSPTAVLKNRPFLLLSKPMIETQNHPSGADVRNLFAF